MYKKFSFFFFLSFFFQTNCLSFNYLKNNKKKYLSLIFIPVLIYAFKDKYNLNKNYRKIVDYFKKNNINNNSNIKSINDEKKNNLLNAQQDKKQEINQNTNEIENFKKDLNIELNKLNNENIYIDPEEEQKNETEKLTKNEKYFKFYDFLEISKEKYSHIQEITNIIEEENKKIKKYFDENYGNEMNFKQIKELEYSKKEYCINNQLEELFHDQKLYLFKKENIKKNKSKISKFLELIFSFLNNNNKYKNIKKSILLFCLPIFFINNKDDLLDELNEYLDGYLSVNAFNKNFIGHNFNDNINLMKIAAYNFKKGNFKNYTFNKNATMNDIFKINKNITFEYFYLCYIYMKHFNEFKFFINTYIDRNDYKKFNQYFSLKFHIQHEEELLNKTINIYPIIRFDYVIKFFINNYNNLVEAFFNAKIKNNLDDFFSNAFSPDHCYNYQAGELTTYILKQKNVELDFKYVFKEDKDIKNTIIYLFKKYKDEFENDEKKYKNDDEIYQKILQIFFSDIDSLKLEKYKSNSMYSGNFFNFPSVNIKIDDKDYIINFKSLKKLEINNINNMNNINFNDTLKEIFKNIIDDNFYNILEEEEDNKNIDENIDEDLLKKKEQDANNSILFKKQKFKKYIYDEYENIKLTKSTKTRNSLINEINSSNVLIEVEKSNLINDLK